MTAVLIVAAGVLWACYRWGRKLAPLAKKALDLGDDLGGMTMFFAWGGAGVTGRFLSRGARVALWATFSVAALVSGGWVRLVFLGIVGWALWRRSKGRRVEAAEFGRSGFVSKAERKLIHEATTAAMLSMNLGKLTRGGATEQIPPALARWRKLPVTVGGKVVKGHFRYVCRAEPAPGQGLASIVSTVVKGLDGVDDRLRDAVAGTLRVASGREAARLRKAGLVPSITMTSAVPVANRNGEMVGQVELSLWTTDPFRQQIDYPHDASKPIVRSVNDPVPIGLLRSNTEARVLLAQSSGVMGGSGYGKTAVLRPILIAAAHTDAVVIVVSLKGPRDFALLAARYAGGVIVTRPEIAAAVLRWAKDEIDRRNGLSSDELKRLPDIILFVDEAQELKVDILLLIPLVKLGRSARVWTWCVTQYAPASTPIEQGGFPTTLARELSQRMSARIEGGHAAAHVAVGERATKAAGPHFIPSNKARWAGVLFDNDGRYIRAYWIDAEDKAGPMAVCAASCGPRPADPPGFLEALTRTAARQYDSVPSDGVTPLPQYDGAVRDVDGVARSLVLAEVPEDVLVALSTLGLAGRPNQKTVGATRIASHMASITGDDDDELTAAATLEAFMHRPRIPVPSHIHDDESE